MTFNGRAAEIRNFLGEKHARKVDLLEGVECVRTADQIKLSSNDVASVSLTATKIQQVTNIRHKDSHEFLDSAHASEKSLMKGDNDE